MVLEKDTITKEKEKMQQELREEMTELREVIFKQKQEIQRLELLHDQLTKDHEALQTKGKCVSKSLEEKT